MFQAILNTLSELWTGINNTNIIITDNYTFSLGQVLIGTSLIAVLSHFIVIIIKGKGSDKDE